MIESNIDITCKEADAICPDWSKSKLNNCVNRVALEFICVLLFPKASKTVNKALSFSIVKILKNNIIFLKLATI